MYKLGIVLSFLCLSSISASSNLPSSFQKCNRKQCGFEQCLAKAVENAISQLVKPFPEVGLPILDPLEVPAWTLPPGKVVIKFQQNYKNVKVSGYSKIQVSKFDLNFDKKTIEFLCLFPKLRMEFEYDFNGTIYDKPIYGKGPGVYVLDNLKFTYNFDLEQYQKKNVDYLKITKSKLIMDEELITYKLYNLFNGDEKKGDKINQVFNENWKEVFDDVRPSYEYGFDQIFAQLFSNVLEKVSISELFDG